MSNFNLVSTPWIPVRWLSSASGNTPALVSLETAFARGKEIADLDCNPPERIALMRLLICVTHAAIGLPETPEDWQDFAHDLHTSAPQYLNRPDIHPQFNLLGDGPRFLQNATAKGGTTYPISKICPELSSGNNPTLLDHWGDEPRPWQAPQAARALLCIQNFFIGGMMASAVKGNGPALKSLQLFIQSENLLATIKENCLSEESLQETTFDLGEANWQSAPAHDYLSYLVPDTCHLWLDDDLQRLTIGQGWQHLQLDAYRDPFLTTLTTDKVRFILRAQPGRGIWRDLHLLTALRSGDNQDSALNLQESQQRNFGQNKKNLSFWTGELIKAKDAKILDTLESTFTVNHALFTEAGNRIYASGAKHAEEISKKLYGALKSYGSSLGHESFPTNEGQKHYWHGLDLNHRTLLDLAADPASRLGKPAIGSEGAEDTWTEAVRKAALNAYATACPTSTPRHKQAYTAGIKPLMRALYPKSKTAKKTAQKVTKKEPAQTEFNI